MDIQEAIATYGVRNILVRMPAYILHDAGFVKYTSCSDTPESSNFMIACDEAGYNYKIRFVSTDRRFADDRLYTSDFDGHRANEPEQYKLFVIHSDGYTEIL
jgi:hypothetical protein